MLQDSIVKREQGTDNKSVVVSAAGGGGGGKRGQKRSLLSID